jgi:hypothetical protein
VYSTTMYTKDFYEIEIGFFSECLVRIDELLTTFLAQMKYIFIIL